jgi:hypothetical protein
MIPPPGPPQQSPDNLFAWLERHPYVVIVLKVIGALVLGVIAFFLWIFDAHRFAITTGVFTICLIVSIFMKK